MSPEQILKFEIHARGGEFRFLHERPRDVTWRFRNAACNQNNGENIGIGTIQASQNFVLCHRDRCRPFHPALHFDEAQLSGLGVALVG